MPPKAARSAAVLALLLLFLVQPGCALWLRMSPEETILPPAEGEVVELPTTRCANMFHVSAMINGRGPYTLLIDTGAVGTVLTPETAAELGEFVRPTLLPALGATGAITTIRQRVNIESMRIGDIEFRGMDAFVIDLTGFDTVAGGDLDGILGYRAFDDVLLTLDYPESRVLLQRGALSDPGDGSVVPIDGQHVPWIDMHIQGRKWDIIIDSGSSGDLSLRKAEKLDWAAPPRVVGTVMAIGGHELRRIGRAAGEARIGDHVLERPMVEPRSAVSLLGTQILKEFRLTFDQRKRLVRFEKASREPLEFPPLYGIGIGTLPRDHGLRVTHVFEGLPAEAAGLRVGDFIESVNGRPLLELVCERERIFSRETTAVLGIVRDGERIEIPVQVITLVP